MKNLNEWFQGLKMTGKVTFISALAIVFLGVVGATAEPNSTTIPSVNNSADVKGAETAPVVTTKTETTAESIPYGKQTIESSSLDKGATQIKTYGVDGSKVTTYTITLTDGVETSRVAGDSVTIQPIDEVMLVGTYVKPVVKAQSSCDPNYSGCVPIASDVDCAGGSGNGPAYVKGPVQVIGTDIYGLDRDHDGWGCE